MGWNIIYVIDLFVSEKIRGQWVGRALIEKL
jgi:GNAT superfamily N-acetyltransferase